MQAQDKHLCGSQLRLRNWGKRKENRQHRCQGMRVIILTLAPLSGVGGAGNKRFPHSQVMFTSSG